MAVFWKVYGRFEGLAASIIRAMLLVVVNIICKLLSESQKTAIFLPNIVMVFRSKRVCYVGMAYHTCNDGKVMHSYKFRISREDITW